MKVYFEKEGLIESQEFYERDNPSYCLFSSISSVYPFVKFEEELADINDYCFFILCKLQEKIGELIQEAQAPYELINGYGEKEDFSEQELESFFDPEYMFSPVLTWETLSRDINKCTLLLLLLSYLESSLNEIVNWFCEEKAIPVGRKEKGESEISFSIKKIGQCCGCDLLRELERELDYLGKVKKIRNEFVHKEWAQTNDRYKKFRLCEVINVISSVFTKVEKAACDGKIIEKNWI